ncbi:MAG TPA: hybrid sensor histidine kinase/response regulator [Burkholderiales bacterium]|nr:hybrid sensor histidine kinase/response regulator [Burkholderiales bacterium]
MGSANATLLSWIAPEVNQALTVVRDHIAKVAAEPASAAALGICSDHLHQVSGALRMVGLAGATRMSEAIEASMPARGESAPARGALAVIDRAVQALREFVDGLERGQPNEPLRLFPAYRELSSLQGKLDSSERDLFFPDLAPQAPAHPAAKTLPAEELPAYIQAQRALFQRGLLAWLRGSSAGLKEMRQALDALHQVAAQMPPPQAIWWVATGFVESIEKAADAEWLAAAKALGNKIERQMREGAETVNESLLREMLYAIVKCNVTTPLIREIRQLYHLESQNTQPSAFDGTVEFDLEWLEHALYNMHSRLDALKTAWERYVSGEQKAAARFRDLVASFRAKAAELGNQHLLKLLEAIALVTKHLPDPCPRQNQFMVIEMAAAFLLVENIIDHFTSPPDDLDLQIVIMGGWLLDSAQGKATDEPPPGLRPELLQQIGALQLRAQVAKQILTNLQHVEQVLDAFSRDADKRNTLHALKPYLRQIHGALVVLGFQRAAQALAVCEVMIAQCEKPGYAMAVDDMDHIAEGLSSLGFFLDPCLRGREPARDAVELFFSRFERHTEITALPDSTIKLTRSALQKKMPGAKPVDVTAKMERVVQPPPAHPPAPAPAKARGGVDQELLGVFLEEAVEVLKNIGASVPAARAHADDVEALTTIRRGFHTLKGSGRMVGLMDLGEVAWEIEQVMNLWLKEKRAATGDLLDLIDAAGRSFSSWVGELQAGTLAGEIAPGDLVTRAQALRGVELPRAAAPKLEEPDEVAIGALRVPKQFFEIYVAEAAAHAAMLRTEGKRWGAAPGSEVPQELMRAAHTLGSSSRTAGFTEIADLAGALEQWVPFARQTQAADAGVVQSAIGRLDAMVGAVRRREPPAAGAQEAAALGALVARLKATPPPVEITRSMPTPAVVKDQRVVRDDVDEQLMPVFLEEAETLVPLIGADLRDWKANPADAVVMQSLQRSLHTFKGSSRMAGAIRLGELTHLMESRIEEAVAAGQFSAELFEWLENSMDRLSLEVERMQAGLKQLQEALPVAAVAPGAPVAQAPAPARAAEAPLPSPAAVLRVNADTLDQLINEAGEVAIARSRIEGELRVIRQSLADLGESIARLRGQLREVEVQADSQMQSRLSVVEERGRDYDPLEFDRYTRLQELTRLMAESLNDVVSIQQGLTRNVGETDAALLQQARTNRSVQEDLMRMRAVPFSNLNERLFRVVRQSARDLDKKAELAIEGAEIELDRSVLERIGAPLDHLLRNAVAHGLEAPGARTAAGKPEAGRISVTLRQESNEIALIVADDGAGLDLDELQSRAAAKGLLPLDRQLSEQERMQLVFASGLSTAESVTELAGRGVGMDVVRNEVTAIGGRIDIASKRGQGTTFTLYLPLTLAVTQAVLVRAGQEVLALPSAMVEQVLRLKAEAVAELYGKSAVTFQDRTYPLHYLGGLLGLAGAAEAQSYGSVLLLRSGIQRIALHVDELIGNYEIVVKNIGPQLARAPGVSGATVLGDGRIVLIVNPVLLSQRERVAAVPAPAQPAAAAPVVMVVDDSLTVRKVTSRLLEREGYQVVTAKDGVDALEQVKNLLPTVMLVDIEMPRMDGFDLTRNLRADPRTREIPIIIISSRTADKHRSQAASLGVNIFLGKPYPEAELLQYIAEYVAAGPVGGARVQ